MENELEFARLIKSLPNDLLDREWDYFVKNARRARHEYLEPGKEYFIHRMDSEPTDDNLIYASDPRVLRVKHLQQLEKFGYGSTGQQVKHNLEWLERMEGKKR